MKFKDIPQFITTGSWECDFSLPSFIKEIRRMVEEEGLVLNPDFQRGHVWTEEQQIKYVEFVLKGGKTGKVIYLNYPSWHRSVPKGAYNEFVCVDGLQRITAIERFLNNEIKVFGHYYSEYEDSPRSTTHTMKINANDLKTKEEVLQWYIDFNSGGTVHSEEEIERVKGLLESERKSRKE